jgi:two-component system chemotaxis response regulator CheB
MGTRVLVAEDNQANATLFRRALADIDCDVTHVLDGNEALELLARESFDVLVTDWMMPHMDGIELIQRMRATIKPVPLTIMVTAVDSAEARERALDAGADDYMAKPIDVRGLQTMLQDGLARLHHTGPIKLPPLRVPQVDARPDFPCVAIGSSTGGPQEIPVALKGIPSNAPASFFLVQHAPDWALVRPKPGHLYVARGDRHLAIGRRNFRLKIEEGPKESFVRPSADWLFRSVAAAYGEYCIGVILTGLGRNGTLGSAHIGAAGGTVIAEDPATASMPFMPRSAVEMGVAKEIAPLNAISRAIMEHVLRLNELLRWRRAA